MIVKVILYTAVCDHCGKRYNDEYNDTLVAEDEFSLQEMIIDAGWEESDNFDNYCTECYYFDDENKLALKEDRKDKYLK